LCANVQITFAQGTTIAVSLERAAPTRCAVIDQHRIHSPHLLEKSTMKPFKRISVLFLAIVCASLLGCVTGPTQESPGEYLSDSWITTKVKTALIDDPQVKANQVTVETFKGAVQLSGFVSSDAARERAVQVARGIEGVTSVTNDMRLR
jgi:hypothetical protein